MRIAIVSDIHANLPAWNAVLADTTVQNVDKIICLGDIVGYGPQPAEVLSSVYTHIDQFVLGNHDAVVAGLMQPKGFNPIARQLIEQTMEMLGERVHDVLQDSPLLLKHDYFCASHGSPAAPKKFAYIMNEDDARLAWKKIEGRVFCVGHTHVPRMHVMLPNGKYKRFQVRYQPLKLREGNRYILNCGSVGMSRDGDFRAAYLIIDTDADTACWHRVSYDIQAFKRAVQDVYQDPELALFLIKRFDKTIRTPVRELIDFQPGQSEVSDEVTDQQELLQAHNSLKKWRLITSIAVFLLLAAAFTAISQWTSMPQRLSITAENGGSVIAAAALEGWGHDFLDVTPTGSSMPHNRPIPLSWSARLDDADRQSVKLIDGTLMVESDSDAPLFVTFQPIDVRDMETVEWSIAGVTGTSGIDSAVEIEYHYTRATAKEEVVESVENVYLSADDNGRIRGFAVIELEGDSAIIRLQLRINGPCNVKFDQIHVFSEPTARRKVILMLNEADKSDLQGVYGIGESRARDILTKRKELNSFESLDELLEIRGVNERILDNIKEYFLLKIKQG